MSYSTATIEKISEAQNGNTYVCGKIIEENSALIWSIARRFFGRGVEPDDLYQLGCIGMMKAIQGYNAEYGTMFSTYAVPKISGEIRRFLRDDGIIKVSRSIKSASCKIFSAREQLRRTLGREPTVSEISAETGIDIEDIATCENVSFGADSLQRDLYEDGNGTTLQDSIGTDSHEEEVLTKVMVSDAIAALNDTEQKIIRLRFFKSLTQQQTAKILNVSQVQVSRLERKAIEKLRRKIS